MKSETFQETLSRRVIDPATRDRWITAAYMAVSLLMLLHHVYITVHFPFPENGAIPLRYPWVIFAGITILLGRMWKDPCFWLLSALLLMKFLRIAIPSPELLSETQTVYELCIYAFFICYGAGRVFSRKDRETFIRLFCALWTLAMTVYACIGLYVVFTGIEVPNLSTRPFYLHPSENRLWPVYHPVEAGTLSSLSIAVALIGFFITRRKPLRLLYLPAILLIFLLNIFCASRTSYILTALCISAPAALFLYELPGRLKRSVTPANPVPSELPVTPANPVPPELPGTPVSPELPESPVTPANSVHSKRSGKAFTALRLAVAAAGFLLLTGLLLLLQMKTIPVYNSLRSQTPALISTASADPGHPAPQPASSEFSADSDPFAGIPEIPESDATPLSGATPDSVADIPSDPAELSARAFVTEEGLDGFLTGRYEIWYNACSGISHYPIYALIGAGVYDPMDHINTYIRDGLALPWIYHFHSTFIQTLWESGFPGYLAFLTFFILFALSAIRLIRNRSLPFWQRVLPLPALLCWLADMVDCAGYCNWGKPPMTLLYLFTGLTILLAREHRPRKHRPPRRTSP